MLACMMFFFFFFFFNDTATTEIYTLSLHDALPILPRDLRSALSPFAVAPCRGHLREHHGVRSEEHTSELQSHVNLVCRLLLEKQKKKIYRFFPKQKNKKKKKRK